MALTPVLEVELTLDELAVLAFLEGRPVPASLQPGAAPAGQPEDVAGQATRRLDAARSSLAESDLVDVVDDEAYISSALRDLLSWVCDPEWSVEASEVGPDGAATLFRLSGVGANGTFVGTGDTGVRLVSGDAAAAIRPVLDALVAEAPSSAGNADRVLSSNSEQIPGWAERRALAVVAASGPDRTQHAVSWLVVEGVVWRTVAVDSVPYREPAPEGWLSECIGRLAETLEDGI